MNNFLVKVTLSFKSDSPVSLRGDADETVVVDVGNQGVHARQQHVHPDVELKRNWQLYHGPAAINVQAWTLLFSVHQNLFKYCSLRGVCSQS